MDTTASGPVDQLLAYVPEAERVAAIRAVMKNLNVEADAASLEFAATLLRKFPDHEAERALIEHLCVRVGHGEIEISLSPCYKNPVVRDGLSTEAIASISRGLAKLQNSDKWLLVQTRDSHAVTMGNAIRQLKLEISGSDIDLPEQDVCLSFLYSSSPTLIPYTGERCPLRKDR